MNVNVKGIPGATKHTFTFNGMPVSLVGGYAESGTLFFAGKLGEHKLKGFVNHSGAGIVESDALGKLDTPGFTTKVKELIPQPKPEVDTMKSAARKTSKKPDAPKSKTEKMKERAAKAAPKEPTPAKEPATKPAATKKPASEKKPATAKPAKEKKYSMLDAAYDVLKGSEPMGTKAIYDAMVAKKLWTSPGGKTPQNTLHAALAREIKEKGTNSRFTKTDKGFAAK